LFEAKKRKITEIKEQARAGTKGAARMRTQGLPSDSIMLDLQRMTLRMTLSSTLSANEARHH
jgi:hypothetical protein